MSIDNDFSPQTYREAFKFFSYQETRSQLLLEDIVLRLQ